MNVMSFLKVWIRVTFGLDLVYKLHCDGRDWVSAHGMPSMHSCKDTINTEGYIQYFRATIADKYHKRFQTVEQVIHQTREGKIPFEKTSTMAETC